VPAAISIGYLFNPTNPGCDEKMRAAEIAACSLGVRLEILKTTTPGEIQAAFAMLVERQIGAFLADSDPLFFTQRAQLVALAARYAVPAIYHARESVEVGGLMSYGANFADAYRLAGTYASRILKGEKPADLPVQQSVRIGLLLNLKTAKALGLTVPTNILLRADEVIE
jgi:ABC-type uncharacterized transport system substrate-binding protein